MYNWTSDIWTTDIRTLQLIIDFSWEQIFNTTERLRLSIEFYTFLISCVRS